MVFSLGNSFQTVPLDRAIAFETLLQPLQPQANTGIGDAIDRLLSESTHPPVYFVLAHLWTKLFPLQDGLVSLWASRAFSAMFGVVSIPAMFGFGYLAFRSRLVGQLAAAMMAVSPYGVFLAQEARHYTLAILLLIGSLSCFVLAIQCLKQHKTIPTWLGFIWVVVNSLGIATHYFLAFSLIAEGLVLLLLVVNHKKSQIFKLLWVAAGTLAGGLVWLPVWQKVQGNELTKWIYEGDPIREFFLPIGRVLIWAISMLSLLPVDIISLPLAVVVASGAVMVIFLIWAIPILWRGFKFQMKQEDTRLEIKVLSLYVLGILLIILGFTYGLGMDLTLAARFHFIYFPAAIALFGVALAANWSREAGENYQLPITNYQLPVVIILLMGFVGSLVVIGNTGYLQHERNDILAETILKESQSPVLIATTHKHHGQTGRMMALAWEFKRLDTPISASKYPQFLLAHKHQGFCKDKLCNDPNNDPSITLQETVAKLPHPLDVWLVNFHAPETLDPQKCQKLDPRSFPKIEGYRIRHYKCQ